MEREVIMSTVESPGSTVITPDGDLLIAGVRDVQAAISSVISSGKRELIIDFRKVEYLSSLGIGAILQGLRQARESGGEIKLVNVSPPLRRIFALAGIENVLDICETEEEALAGFGRQVGPIERNLLWAIRPAVEDTVAR